MQQYTHSRHIDKNFSEIGFKNNVSHYGEDSDLTIGFTYFIYTQPPQREKERGQRREGGGVRINFHCTQTCCEMVGAVQTILDA
jgi:hypothetical protein